MKFVVLYNPLSDNKRGEEFAKSFKVGEGDSIECLVRMTEVDYKEFFAALENDCALLILGGDGTLNRFINDTAGFDYDNKVYYYPSGSGNDFWRDVNPGGEDKPLDITAYIKGLPEVTVKDGTYRFLNNVGFGIDGYCCEVGDEMRANSVEKINYTSIAIKGLLFRNKPTGATVTVDGKTFSFENVWLAPTMNGRFYGGGMMPTPEQDRAADDGKLSVMVYHCKSKLKALMTFPKIFKGEHVKSAKIVTILTGYDINVKFDEPKAV